MRTFALATLVALVAAVAASAASAQTTAPAAAVQPKPQMPPPAQAATCKNTGDFNRWLDGFKKEGDHARTCRPAPSPPPRPT